MRSILMNAAGLAVSVVLVLAIVMSANALTHAGTFTPATARKAIHVALAHWWLLAVAMFDDPRVASVGPACSLLASMLVPAVLPLSKEATVCGRDRGVICYSAALLILVNISWRGFIPARSAAAGVLVMGWGDGLAGLVGPRLRTGQVSIWGTRKTLAGSAVMFLTSCAVILLLTVAANQPWPRLLLGVTSTAAVATLLELLTPSGFDNLTISVGTALFFAGAFG